MVTLLMTSAKFTGTVTFEYNEAGKLESLRIEADLNDQQLAVLGANMPWTQQHIQPFCELSKFATFVMQDRDVSFEMFWNRYNDKTRSSKKKTEKEWMKLGKVDQVKAYMFIPIYLKNKGTAEKKYATTYLSDELWNN